MGGRSCRSSALAYSVQTELAPPNARWSRPSGFHRILMLLANSAAGRARDGRRSLSFKGDRSCRCTHFFSANASPAVETGPLHRSAPGDTVRRGAARLGRPPVPQLGTPPAALGGATQRRAAKLTSGQRTRIGVTSIVPRPLVAAATMSSSLLSSTGVTPAFQWKICRFQAPPV